MCVCTGCATHCVMQAPRCRFLQPCLSRSGHVTCRTGLLMFAACCACRQAGMHAALRAACLPACLVACLWWLLWMPLCRVDVRASCVSCGTWHACGVCIEASAAAQQPVQVAAAAPSHIHDRRSGGSDCCATSTARAVVGGWTCSRHVCASPSAVEP